MKKRFKILAVFVLLLSAALPASAQLSFGVKAGANFTDIKLKGWDSNTATGWYAGPTLEVMIRGLGLGVEGSLLYSRLSTDYKYDHATYNAHVDYLTLPVNLKYKFPLPMVRPFVLAGPEFSVKVNDHIGRAAKDLWKTSFNGADMMVNVGLGIELLGKLQISCSYNRGVTNSYKHFDSKTNNWRVGAGLYF